MGFPHSKIVVFLQFDFLTIPRDSKINIESFNLKQQWQN